MEVFIYLNSLDTQIKIFKWYLKHFIIALAPTVLIVLTYSPFLMLFGLMYSLIALGLTYQLNANEYYLKIITIKVGFYMTRKIDTNQQTFEVKRLQQMKSELHFKKIESDHIDIDGKKKGFFFVMQSHNLNLLSYKEQTDLIKSQALFYRALVKFRVYSIEIAQDLTKNIAFNNSIITSNKNITELLKLRGEYLARIQEGKKEENKITVVYIETTEKNTQLFIHDVKKIAKESNVNIQSVEDDFLRQVMTTVITGIGNDFKPPLNVEEVLR